MNVSAYLLHGWTANPIVLGAIVVATAAYARLAGRRGRAGLFAAAMAVLAVALLSPVNFLANGVLFSAHMTQHILLLLFVPGLLLLSLPPRDSAPERPLTAARGARSAMFWLLGVGAMWAWHVPRLCSAAATTPGVHALQTVSLLAMGTAFWWPILAPSTADRLIPGHGVAYLFLACLACTGLGALVTLSPVEVCPAFTGPSSAPALWSNLREQLGVRRDQQIGGLLMWVPMCLVYVAGIVLELARWLGEPTPLRTSPQRPA